MNEITELEQDKNECIDEGRRQFLLTTSCAIGGIGALCALTPFVSSWLPSVKAKAAGAPIQVDLSNMQSGEQKVIEWRGKPVWIIRRSEQMLRNLANHSEKLRDPRSLVKQQPVYANNEYRSINPEYLILIGVCTHLGCSPKYKPTLGELGADWPGGFFCPCHGSTFDLAGRVFKDVPAPINMEVPPHYFIDSHTVIIGEDKKVLLKEAK